MTNNQDDYEDIDDKVSKTGKSIYQNPAYDDEDEVKRNLN